MWRLPGDIAASAFAAATAAALPLPSAEGSSSIVPENLYSSADGTS